MNYSTFFSKQARKPSGIFGRFYMSQVFDKGNIELNDHLHDILSVKENDQILEIGSGTGTLACKIANQLTTGMIQGVDFSKSMFKISKKNNRTHIASGRAKLHFGDFEELSFNPDYFDKIFSVNTVYFWQHPETTITKMISILKPSGKLVIGYHEKSEMEKMPLNRDVFKYYSVSEIEKLLSSNDSLSCIETISKKGKGKTCFCTIALKSIA